MDVKTRIENAKQKLKRAETVKITAETQLEAAEKQKAEIVGEMAAQGVTPENIQPEIAKLEAEIVNDLEKAEKLIPEV